MPLLVATVSMYLTPAHNHRYRWHCANYDLMCNYLSTIDWSNVVCYNPEVSQLWETFSAILSMAVNTAVPIAVNNRNRQNTTNACYSRMVRNCVKLCYFKTKVLERTCREAVGFVVATEV